jgi:hypothetical protein
MRLRVYCTFLMGFTASWGIQKLIYSGLGTLEKTTGLSYYLILIMLILNQLNQHRKHFGKEI